MSSARPRNEGAQGSAEETAGVMRLVEAEVAGVPAVSVAGETAKTSLQNY